MGNIDIYFGLLVLLFTAFDTFQNQDLQIVAFPFTVFSITSLIWQL